MKKQFTFSRNHKRRATAVAKSFFLKVCGTYFSRSGFAPESKRNFANDDIIDNGFAFVRNIAIRAISRLVRFKNEGFPAFSADQKFLAFFPLKEDHQMY